MRLPAQLAGRYRGVRVLGKGGFGKVLEAQDLELGRPVAIKLLEVARGERGEALDRFVREAAATALIRHPDVVQVYDHGVDPGGEAWIIYELIEGSSLERFAIGGAEVAAPERVVRWGIALAGALEAVHRQGLLHRDVKPANIMLRAGDSPVLCDFGLAKGREDMATLTKTGQVMGTPLYLASEIWRGELPTPASDQYGLGMVLYELLYGSREPWGGSFDSVMQAALEARKPFIPAAGRGRLPAVEAALLRALDPDPRARFRTMGEMAEALGSRRGGGTVPAAVPGVAPPQARRVLRTAAHPQGHADAGPGPFGSRTTFLAWTLAGLVGLAGVLAGGALRRHGAEASRVRAEGTSPPLGVDGEARDRLIEARAALLKGHAAGTVELTIGGIRKLRTHAKESLDFTAALDLPARWAGFLRAVEGCLATHDPGTAEAGLAALDEVAVHLSYDLDVLRTEVKNSFNALFERPSIVPSELPGLQDRISRIERETIGFCDRLQTLPVLGIGSVRRGRGLALVGILRGQAEDTRAGPDCLQVVLAEAEGSADPGTRLRLLRAEELLFNPAVEKMITCPDRARTLAGRPGRIDSLGAVVSPPERAYLEARLVVHWVRTMRECPEAVTDAHLAGLGAHLDRLDSGLATDPSPVASELSTALRVLDNSAGLTYRMLEPRFVPLRDRIAAVRDRARPLAEDRPPPGP